MAVADTKVPLFKDHFWHFQIKMKFRKRKKKSGQRPTTGPWFDLDYSVVFSVRSLKHILLKIILFCN